MQENGSPIEVKMNGVGKYPQGYNDNNDPKMSWYRTRQRLNS